MKSAVILSLLAITEAVVLPAAPSSEAGPSPIRKIPIAGNDILPRSDGSADIPAFLASVNRTLTKWGAQPLPYYPLVAEQQEKRRADAAASAAGRNKEGRVARRQSNLALTDDFGGNQGTTDDAEDMEYYGPVVIGAGDGKPQTFTLNFDTSTSDIWVYGPGCAAYFTCQTTVYDEGGTSLGTTTSATYSWGTADGTNYVDDVTVAGYTSPNQTLFSVDYSYAFPDYADGVLGLAFSSLAQDHGTTFFENLIAQGAIDTQEFGFYLGRFASGTQYDSEITLGGRDSTKYTGSFTTIPVTSETFWQVDIGSVTVAGALPGVNTGSQAAFDTESVIITAPLLAAQEIMNKIPGSFPIQDGLAVYYAYPCNTTALFMPTFHLAGQSFTLNLLDFKFAKVPPLSTGGDDSVFSNPDIFAANGDASSCIIEETGCNYCISTLIGANLSTTAGYDEDLYVLGNSFMKNWYTVMSYDAFLGKPAVLLADIVG